MSTFDDLMLNKCIAGLVIKPNKKMPKKEKTGVLKEISDRLDSLKGDKEPNRSMYGKLFNELATEKETIKNYAQALNKDIDYKKLDNLIARKYAIAQKMHRAYLYATKRAFIDSTNPKDESRPLLSLINGIIDKWKKWAKFNSTDSHIKVKIGLRYEDFANDLKASKVHDEWMNDEWMAEHAVDIATGLKYGHDKVDNAEAKEISRITRKHFSAVMTEMRNGGIPIESIDDFMGTFHRNPEKLLSPTGNIWKDKVFRYMHPGNFGKWKQVALDRWRKNIINDIELDRVFPDIKDNPTKLNAVLEKTFDHNTLDNPRGRNTDKNALAFRGLGSIALKHRVYHYTPEGFIRAIKTEGYGDLRTTILKTLDDGTKMGTMAQEWSTLPYNVFDDLMKDAKENLHKKPINQRAKLNKALEALYPQFDEMTGVAKIPAHSVSAHATNSIITVEALGKLGGSFIKAWTDFGGAYIQARNMGMSHIESAVNPIMTYAKLFGGKNAYQDVVDAYGYWMDSTIGSVMTRFASVDSMSDTQMKVMNGFFTLTGLHRHDRSLYGSVVDNMGRWLWKNSKYKFEELNPELQRMLGQYAIESKDWDLIRKNPFTLPNKKKIITPDDPYNYSDDAMKKYIGDSNAKNGDIVNSRNDFRQKLVQMFNHEAHTVFLSNTTSEQAMMRWGTKPGTIGGMLNRLIVQTHSWSFAVTHRILGDIYSDILHGYSINGIKGTGRPIQNAIGYASVVTVMSYLGDQFKNIVMSKKPQAPGLDTVGSGLEDAAGIVGQVASTIFSKQSYEDRLVALGGLTAGTADQMLNIVGDTMQGNTKKLKLDIYYLVKGLIPGNNIFYLKPALNHLIFYNVLESINPGALDRMVRNSEKEGNAQYFLPPTSTI